MTSYNPEKPHLIIKIDLSSSLAAVEEVVTRVIKQELAAQEAAKPNELRLTSEEAAAYLGRSVGYLRALHKQGLAYEKGRPNHYKLSDLENWREGRRLQLG
jgi:hypothetical protein